MARGKKKAADAKLSPRDYIKRYLVQRFYTRFHMSLILMSAGLAAMVVNWGLLHAGVGRMWVRYPLAVGASYLTFLAGVWLWIQYIGYRKRQWVEPAQVNPSRRSSLDGADAIDLVPSPSGGGGGSGIADGVGGGGGAFDGGGASGSWDDVVPAQSLVSNPGGGSVSPSSGGGFSFDFGDLDGDGLVVLVLALMLVAAVVLVSGYIVWFAPDILTEALFGAVLAGGVAKAAKREDAEGWVMGVVKKTWWPFAIVLAVALAFAIFAQTHYPQARTMGETFVAALAEPAKK